MTQIVPPGPAALAVAAAPQTLRPARATSSRARLLGTAAGLGAVVGAALLGPVAAPRAQSIAPNAAPSGGRVVAGSAGIAQSAAQTTVNQTSGRAAVDWQQFNVGSQHRVQFNQPSAQSWTLNRVVGPDPSVIAGRVAANGGVAIVNQAGIVFANGAQVDVGSLIASAANITNQNFMAGQMRFDGPPRPGARVENRGTITVAQRGLAALAAPEVRNSGAIRARLGRVALAGAETFTLDLAGDGLISIDVTRAVQRAPSGDGATALVTNSGVIQAEGGSVLLTAHAASGLVETLVSNPGRIEAPTVAAAGTTPERAGLVALRAEGGGVRVDGTIVATGGAGGRGGAIEATASGAVLVAGRARLDASGAAGGGRVTVGAALSSARGRPERLARRTVVERGAEIRADATTQGAGGEVIVHAAEHTEFRGRASATGGPAGGAGGQIEISSRGAFAMDGTADASAPAGTPGSVLIDPIELRVVQTLSGATEPAEITAAAVSGSGGNLLLDATQTVRVLAGVDKANGNLALLTTGVNPTGIVFEAPVIVRNGVLEASTAGEIRVAGGVTLQGGAGQASINGVRLTAGRSITNDGSIIGIGGGAILSPQGTVFAASLGTNGTLTNTGTIEGRAGAGSANGGLVGLVGGTVINAGTVFGPGVAVAATGAIGNSGLMEGRGAILFPDGVSRAVFLRAGGPVSNAGTGAIRGTGGAVQIDTGTALANAGAIQALSDLQLRAGVSVANAGGLAAGRDALVAAGGWVDNAGTVTAATGRAALLAGGAGLPAGQAWAIRQAGTGSVAAPGGPAGAGGVPANPGDLVLRAEAGAVELLGGSLSAARDATITAAAGALTAQDVAIAAGRAMRLEAGGPVLLARATIGAETLVARSGADPQSSLTLDGATFALGQAALFGAGGAIAAGAASTVTPRSPGLLPAVLFDVRRGAAAATTIPAGVAPDLPGLAPDQQATQVRLPGQDAPGTFGPASGAAAGTVQLSLDAGSAPVFLLLDGGSAGGRLAAGRLGLQGTGGGATLEGSLGGRADGTAAQLGDITRPVAPAVQASYRFNGCVVGLSTCEFVVVPPPSPPAPPPLVPPGVAETIALFPLNTLTVTQLIEQDVAVATRLGRLFVPEPELFRLRRNRGRLAEPDVLLPNTSEEDF